MKKLFLAIMVALFIFFILKPQISWSCGVYVPPPSCYTGPTTLVALKYDATDWDANVSQGWQWYNTAINQWVNIPGANSVTYVATLPSNVNTRKYRFWAKELSSPLPGNNNGFTYYSEVTVSRCIVTPVSLTGFTAAKQSGTIEVQWTAQIEVNVSQYELFRSYTDAEHFTSIATIPAKGVGVYRYSDTADATKTIFYQLRVVENDGKIASAGIVRVSADKTAGISVGPNPTQGTVRIYGPKQYDVLVYSMSGALVVQAKNTSSVPLEKFPPGIYLLIVSDETGVLLRQKVLKN